jgi:hypothetical protein
VLVGVPAYAIIFKEVDGRLVVLTRCWKNIIIGGAYGMEHKPLPRIKIFLNVSPKCFHIDERGPPQIAI